MTDIINTKLTLEMARIKAKNYSEFDRENYLIYVYNNKADDFEGHHITVMESSKAVYDDIDELDFVETIEYPY